MFVTGVILKLRMYPRVAVPYRRLARGNRERKIDLREKIPWQSQEYRGP